MADKDAKYDRAFEFLTNHGKQAELAYNSRLQLWVPSVYSLTTKYRTLHTLPGAQIVEGQRRAVLCPTLRAFVDYQYGHDDSLASSQLDAAALELDWHKWLPEVEGSPAAAQFPLAYSPAPLPPAAESPPATEVLGGQPSPQASVSHPAADSLPATEVLVGQPSPTGSVSRPATEILWGGPQAPEVFAPPSPVESPHQAELQAAKQHIAYLESICRQGFDYTTGLEQRITQLQEQLDKTTLEKVHLERANKVQEEQLQSFKEGFSDEGRLVQQVGTLETQIDALQQQMFNAHLDSAETIHNLKSQMVDMAATHEAAMASLRGQLERQQQVIDTLTEGVTKEQAAVKEARQDYDKLIVHYEKELDTARTNLIDKILELEELLAMAHDDIKRLKEKKD